MVGILVLQQLLNIDLDVVDAPRPSLHSDPAHPSHSVKVSRSALALSSLRVITHSPVT